jgi:hypothetical protein
LTGAESNESIATVYSIVFERKLNTSSGITRKQQKLRRPRKTSCLRGLFNLNVSFVLATISGLKVVLSTANEAQKFLEKKGFPSLPKNK